MTLFKEENSSRTPFGFYDSDTEFQSEADSMITFVKRKLGDDIVSVELTKKQIWACFEEGTTVFGAMINKYQTKSQLSSLIGSTSGSFSGSEGKSHQIARENLQFLNRMAEPYAMEAGIGGSYSSSLGYFSLKKNQQDYDIYKDLKEASGDTVFDTLSGSQRTKIKILEVMHFSPAAAYRFFDSTSAINYLNNEFSFESFTPESIFYVLPIFEDIIRAQMMNTSQIVRRSNYSYKIIGNIIRIFPTPTAEDPRKLWLRWMPAPDPYKPLYADNSIYGVSNLSNSPFGNLKYTQINSIGRQWIRTYTLALCSELLGLIRSKFKSLPIPGGEVQLDGDNLITRGREDKEKLMTDLKEILDSLTYDKLILQEADKAANIIRQLRATPFIKGITITIG